MNFVFIVIAVAAFYGLGYLHGRQDFHDKINRWIP
jgi:hypothetical protein